MCAILHRFVRASGATDVLSVVCLVPVMYTEPYNSGYTMNRTDARDWCLSFGDDLVSIHSESQMSDVNVLCPSDSCWIGLKYDSSGIWEWSDGSALDYGFSNGLPTGDPPWSGVPVESNPFVYFYLEEWTTAAATSEHLAMCAGTDGMYT